MTMWCARTSLLRWSACWTSLSLRERGEPRTRGVSPRVKDTNSDRRKKGVNKEHHLGLDTDTE